MIVCPSCGAVNIAGAEACEDCHSSLSDLHLTVPATIVEQSLLNDRVRILSPKKAVVVTINTPVRDVMKALAQNAQGCAVVVVDDMPVGIFSERDVLRRLGPKARELGADPVYRHMTAPVQTLQEDAKIAFAVRQMDQGGYRHLPVVNHFGKITGIISVRQILRYLTDKLAQVS